jgi:response regulator RpfG family c-di-GMP phosphodiesterase
MAHNNELADLEVFNGHSVDRLNEHQRRVSNLAVLFLLVRSGELPESYEMREGVKITQRATALEFGARFHDIGKLFLFSQMIQKPGPLTPEEQDTMKTHPLWGFFASFCFDDPEICHDLLSPFYKNGLVSPFAQAFLGLEVMRKETQRLVREIVLWHHEDWNGQGYPMKLAGKEIPFLARLVHLVDVYDAMRENRPYRGSLSEVETLGWIEAQSGRMFDPELANAFVEMKRNNTFVLDREYDLVRRVNQAV